MINDDRCQFNNDSSSTLLTPTFNIDSTENEIHRSSLQRCDCKINNNDMEQSIAQIQDMLNKINQMMFPQVQHVLKKCDSIIDSMDTDIEMYMSSSLSLSESVSNIETSFTDLSMSIYSLSSSIQELRSSIDTHIGLIKENEYLSDSFSISSNDESEHEIECRHNNSLAASSIDNNVCKKLSSFEMNELIDRLNQEYKTREDEESSSSAISSKQSLGNKIQEVIESSSNIDASNTIIQLSKLMSQLERDDEIQEDGSIYTDSSLNSSYDGCSELSEEDYNLRSEIAFECVGDDKMKMSVIIVNYFINEADDDKKSELAEGVIRVKDKNEFINTDQDDSFILTLDD